MEDAQHITLGNPGDDPQAAGFTDSLDQPANLIFMETEVLCLDTEQVHLWPQQCKLPKVAS